MQLYKSTRAGRPCKQKSSHRYNHPRCTEPNGRVAETSGYCNLPNNTIGPVGEGPPAPARGSRLTATAAMFSTFASNSFATVVRPFSSARNVPSRVLPRLLTHGVLWQRDFLRPPVKALLAGEIGHDGRQTATLKESTRSHSGALSQLTLNGSIESFWSHGRRWNGRPARAPSEC